MKRTVLTILAALAVLIGVIWILQGLNVVLGSAMSGQPIFAVLGAVVALMGGLGLWRLWGPRSA